MILPQAPERYDRTYMLELVRAMELAVTKLEQRGAGWQQATGTADRTTFDTAAVTLPQLAQRVKALVDDFAVRA